ncbi:MAG: hypothetical protein AAFR02_01095 [Pseudomonadota bacterium]
MKNQIIDACAFVCAAIRCAVFVPLYRVVVACERRDIRLPFKVINMALHGQRRARGDWHDMKTYYFGY